MEEGTLVRFGVSIPVGLLKKFDALIEKKGYTSRSEAIRDLIRDDLVESAWQSENDQEEAIGAITLVYDHHSREIADRLTDIAHEHLGLVISSMHAHLTPSACIESLLVKGPGNEIRTLADQLLSRRGVKHGKLVITGLVDEG